MSTEPQHSEASPQHTPGPWKVFPGERMVVRDIMDSPGRTLIAAGALPRDADLIAAAPDLLAALESLMEPEQQCLQGVDADVWERVEAAVALARGNQ